MEIMGGATMDLFCFFFFERFDQQTMVILSSDSEEKHNVDLEFLSGKGWDI